MATDLETSVLAAQQGDRAALTRVVTFIQDDIYRLAIRMLADPSAAEDATQDILVLVVTKLSQFRGQSKFTTWVYRVAANHLLTARKVRARETGLSFELFGEDLEGGLTDHDATEPFDAVLHNELRVACTMAMLLCLDLDHRIAYVLGRILELTQSEAVEILQIAPATYRKRLSRASARVEAFTAQKCGVVAPGTAACSCPKRLPRALEMQRVDPQASLTQQGRNGPGYEDVLQEVARVESSLKTLTAQKSVPIFQNPRDFSQRLEAILSSPSGTRH